MKKILVILFSVFIIGVLSACDGTLTLPTNVTLPTDVTLPTNEETTVLQNTSIEQTTDIDHSTMEPTTLDDTSLVTTDHQTTGVQTTSVPTTVEPTTEEPTTQTPTTIVTTGVGEESFRVFYYNSGAWLDVYAFVWDEYDGMLFGEFPGSMAIREGDSDWWYIDLDTTLDLEQIDIVFNNGIVEDTLQSLDVFLEVATDTYVTITGETFDSKTMAENSLMYSKIWFYNSEEWEDVYGYAWIGYSELFGNWPGTIALVDGENEGWYYIEVPFDLDRFGVNVVFSNNAGEKTADTLIQSSRDVYLSLDGAFNDMDMAEESMDRTTIWFYNSERWDQVYAYATDEDGTELLGAEPGLEAIQDGDGLWCFVNVPVDASKAALTIKFSNGSDALSTVIDSITNIYFAMDGFLYASKQAAVDAMSPNVVSTRVYFLNDHDWSNVYGYVYGSQGEVLGVWPGTMAQQVPDSDWWLIDVPIDASINPFDIIFNNNMQDESGKANINTVLNQYVTFVGLTYETMNAAELAVQTTGYIYFLNTEGWDSVNAYVYGDSGTVFGVWPGRVMEVDPDEEGWMRIEIPSSLDMRSMNIIFNDGHQDQTQTIYLDSMSASYIISYGDAYESASAAQDAYDNYETSTTVYYYNTGGWDSVYAYVIGFEDFEPFGEQPGMLANLVEGEDNWWMVNVPIDIDSQTFDIYFSNGLVGTSGSSIDGTSGLYINMYGEIFETMDETIASIDPTGTSKVYFYNSGGWDQVYAYAFNLEGQLLLNVWPGDMAVQEDDEDWWHIVVPVNVMDENFTIVFSDGEYQTPDVYIFDHSNVFVSLEGNIYPSKEALMMDYLPEETRVYFYNSDGWDQVYIYAIDNLDRDIFGSMPGALMLEDDEEGWFMIQVPMVEDRVSATVVFSNGDDLTTGPIFMDETVMPYVSVDGLTHASQFLAEAHINNLPTTTLYFHNYLMWDDVYGFALDAFGDPLMMWPGIKAIEDPDDSEFLMVELPIDPSKNPFYIYFNPRSQAHSGQAYIYNSTDIYISFSGEVYASKEAVLSSYDHLTRVYFYNSQDWTSTHAYAFGMSGTILGSWPGALMTGQDDGWLYVDVPVDLGERAFSLVFTNGEDDQTPDMVFDTLGLVYANINGQIFDNQDDAVNDLTGLIDSTFIYFYNSDSWLDVYAYAYSDSQSFFGSLPGILASADLNNEGWYYIEVPVNIGDEPVTVLFNDNQGASTIELLVDQNDLVFVTVDGGLYGSMLEAENAMTSGDLTRIYFYNNLGWSQVLAYVYIGESFMTGEWPGVQAKQDLESQDLWYIDVPLDPYEAAFYIIFNDGYSQAGNALISDDVNVYVPIIGQAYDSVSSLMDALAVTETVYFYNSDNWMNVYAYVYGVAGNFQGGWPGDEMVDEGEGWYSTQVPLAALNSNFEIIFTNNQGQETPSAFISSISGRYITIDGSAYMSKEDAQASILPEETMPIYFYNTDGWDHVYILAYAENGSPLTSAYPGNIGVSVDEQGVWWAFDIPVNNNNGQIRVQFNNGYDTPTMNAYILDDQLIYFTMDGGAFASFLSAEENFNPITDYTTIYYYNTDQWDTVYAYAFNEGGIYLGEWHGQAMTPSEDETGWWSIELPVSLTEGVYVVFNDFDSLQTQDIFFTETSGTYANASGGPFVDQASAEANLESVTRIYFYNPETLGWTPRAHLWDYIGDNNELDQTWPGEYLIQDSSQPDWWYVDLSTTTASFKLIISNDGLDQTKDLLVFSYDEVYVSLGDYDNLESKYDAHVLPFDGFTIATEEPQTE